MNFQDKYIYSGPDVFDLHKFFHEKDDFCISSHVSASDNAPDAEFSKSEQFQGLTHIMES